MLSKDRHPIIHYSFIIDTPGYSSIELLIDEESEVGLYMKEFDPYLGTCRFTGCMHLSEPGCSIKQAVSDGKISEVRYESYKEIVGSVRSRKKW